MSTLPDVINFLAHDKMTDAMDAVQTALGQKVLDALEQRKMDIASQLFPSTTEQDA